MDRSYAANGLNQYTAVSGVGYCHDANGNLTADNNYVYLYDVENRLIEMRSRTGATCPTAYDGQLKASLRYDPLGRLHEVTNFIAGVSQGPTRFLYDGDALVAEFDGAGSVLRRHVHGPNAGVDDPLIEYANPYVAPGYAYVRFLYADARGSIVYRADSANASAAINTYDEYGVPGSTNSGRFQYTGQAWLAELGMYYYKARIYSPTLGRFLQTDPIGYEDNNNLYAYVANDPVNAIDPTGMIAVDENKGMSLVNTMRYNISGNAFNGSVTGRGKDFRANAAPDGSNSSQGSSEDYDKGLLSGVSDALESAGQAVNVAAAEAHRAILVGRGVLFKNGKSYTIYTQNPDFQAVVEFYGLALAIGQMPRLALNRGPGSLGGRILDIKPGYTVMLRNSSSAHPTIEFIRTGSSQRRQEFKFEKPKI